MRYHVYSLYEGPYTREVMDSGVYTINDLPTFEEYGNIIREAARKLEPGEYDVLDLCSAPNYRWTYYLWREE